MRKLLVLIAAGLLLGGAPAFAQTPSPKSLATGMTKAAKADSTFVRKATVGNMTEVAMGRIALERSQHPGVRDHAQMMAADHETAQRELEQVGGAVDHALDSKHQKMISKLQKVKPEQFDREYAQAQLKAHDEAIKLHQKAAKVGSSNSQQIQQLANRTLPKLQQHKSMTVNLGQQVGAGKVSS